MRKLKIKTIPVAVFDISSGSVAGAHILVHKNPNRNNPISVLANSRNYSPVRDNLNIERYISSTIEDLQKTISLLKKADHHKPKMIQVLLSSPWFVSQNRNITYKQSAEFTCTKKLMDSLVEKEIKHIMENDMDNFGSMGKDSVIIEKQISQIKLNGYTTSNPFGKKIRSLELFLVVTISPKVILDKFKEEFKKNYGFENIKFTTSSYATFIVARDFFDFKNELMIIDIGEELTDIACVKEDLFMYQHSFPSGVYNFYRFLSKNNDITNSEGFALLEGFKIGKLSTSMTTIVQKSLQEFGDSWQRSLQELLDSEKSNINLPSDLLITCDDKFSYFFQKIIEQDMFLKSSINSNTINSYFINPEKVGDYISSLDKQDIDSTLAIASLFASRIL